MLGDASEILPQRPSTWYLTGFLVPLDADPEQKIDAQSADELDEVSDAQGLEDAVVPEPAAARVRYLPSSLGASLLVPAEAQTLKILVRWGDYTVRTARDDEPGPFVWARTPREEGVVIALPEKTAQPTEHAQPLRPRLNRGIDQFDYYNRQQALSGIRGDVSAAPVWHRNLFARPGASAHRR